MVFRAEVGHLGLSHQVSKKNLVLWGGLRGFSFFVFWRTFCFTSPTFLKTHIAYVEVGPGGSNGPMVEDVNLLSLKDDFLQDWGRCGDLKVNSSLFICAFLIIFVDCQTGNNKISTNF